MSVGDLCDSFNVDDCEQRVRRRFQPDDLRGRIPIRLECRHVGQVGGRPCDAVARVNGRNQPEGSTIGVVAKNNVVTGRQSPQHCVGGSHAACEREPVIGAF